MVNVYKKIYSAIDGPLRSLQAQVFECDYFLNEYAYDTNVQKIIILI